jgi:CHAT domain-containing protein
LKPFQPKISPSTKNLIIIPDGQLYRLPFETLIPDEAYFRDTHTKGDSYLISYFDISYGRSASSVFNVCKNRVMGKTDMDLLVVACAQIFPKNNGSHNNLIEYPPLKYAIKEAKAVLNKFKTGRTKSLFNSEATEENLKKIDLSNFRIIHFITHGVLNKNDWIRSALVLNPGENPIEDSLLHPFEIQNRKFNAELITLSSCYSGSGKLAEGEGVMGLIRAFQLVGAKSLIASLWEVNDRSTSLFMEYFYQFLAEGTPKSSALKQAKLKMIQSTYSHPFYWAPFILFGDYNTTIILN